MHTLEAAFYVPMSQTTQASQTAAHLHAAAEAARQIAADRDAAGTIPEADAPRAAPADWIRGIAAGLSAAGLTTVIAETSAGLDLTATARRPGCKDAEVVIDEDGYAELCWWTDQAATPAAATAALARVLAAALAGSPAVADGAS